MIYEAINGAVLNSVPINAVRILDVGCGTGTLGEIIKVRQKCEIVGITFSADEAKIASGHLNQVISADLNEFDPEPLGKFDCIICSHVLEHLYHPQDILGKLHMNLSHDSVIIVALPNVLYWKQRWNFLRGQFRYAEGGLMDKTHYRFFDWNTASDLLTECRYDVLSRKSDGNMPLPIVRRIAPGPASRLDKICLRYFPGFFGWQSVIIARSLAS